MEVDNSPSQSRSGPDWPPTLELRKDDKAVYLRYSHEKVAYTGVSYAIGDSSIHLNIDRNRDGKLVGIEIVTS